MQNGACLIEDRSRRPRSASTTTGTVMTSANTPTVANMLAPRVSREMAIHVDGRFEHGVRKLPATSWEQLLNSLARLFDVVFVSCFQRRKTLVIKMKNVWRRGTSHLGSAWRSPTSGSYSPFVCCLHVRRKPHVCRWDLLYQYETAACASCCLHAKVV